jgi:hypothetical protein
MDMKLAQGIAKARKSKDNDCHFKSNVQIADLVAAKLPLNPQSSTSKPE